MVFSSNCPQLTNSNHQHPQLHENGYGLLLSQQLPSLQANPNSNHHHAASFSGLPADRMGGSMVEKARQAKLPPPEGALKCPRCDSTNTKFCYYNNYNLTQPRHFCKACRRYWTQGGALRNVPVGGGCRRNNKKSKTGNSKSSSKQSSMVNTPSPSSGQLIRTDHQFPFSSPTHYNLTQLGGISLNLAGTNDDNNQTHQIGSSLMNDLGLLLVGNERNTSDLMTGTIHESNNNNENNLMASVGSLTHYTLFDPTTGLYAFQNEGNIGSNVGVSSSSPYMVDSRVYQTAPVKTEEQSSLANLSRPVSGLTAPGNHTNQYFGTGSDFSAPSNELL